MLRSVASGLALISKHVGLVDNSVRSHYIYPPHTPRCSLDPHINTARGKPPESQLQDTAME